MLERLALGLYVLACVSAVLWALYQLPAKPGAPETVELSPKLENYYTEAPTQERETHNIRHVDLSKKQRKCLLENAYWEARGEGYAGLSVQIQVTLNRVKSDRWEDTVCKVVYEPYQFSWTLDKDKRGDGRLFKRKLSERQKEALTKIRKVIQNIESKGYKAELAKGKVPHHYVRYDCDWEYRDDLEKLARVGNHEIFS